MAEQAPPHGPFNPDWLGRRLSQLAARYGQAGRYVVAFSGGRDSMALLHALSRLPRDVAVDAVHIDHGLSPDSARWATEARKFALDLDVRFSALKAEVVEDGQGPEAAARDARYARLAGQLEQGDWLLTAQHRDDQAETLLLNLLRAAGTLGLAGMPEARPCGRGLLVRPLLGVGRDDLARYAADENLPVIEDPSNADQRFDRNFLRHRVVPILAERWPSAALSLARSSALAAETNRLLEALAAIDLASLGDAAPERLPVKPLRSLPDERVRNLLRYALRQLALPAPPSKRLDAIVTDVIRTPAVSGPEVLWPGAAARRFRDHLYLLPDRAIERPNAATLTPDSPLQMGADGVLALVPHAAGGIRRSLAASGLAVAWRSGGERMKPHPTGGTRSLKNLMLEAGVLPWMRERVPLLVADGRLVAVGDLWIDVEFQEADGYALEWRDRPPLTDAEHAN